MEPIKKAIKALEKCADAPWLPRSYKEMARASANDLRELEKKDGDKQLPACFGQLNISANLADPRNCSKCFELQSCAVATDDARKAKEGGAA